MKITPVDESQYSSRNLWPDGVYPCEIVECEEGEGETSGYSYFKCKVRVFNESNGTQYIYSYIMAEGKAEWQLREAAEMLGVLDQYRKGEITPNDLIGKQAYAVVRHEDANGQFPAKNTIRGYRVDMPKKSSFNNTNPVATKVKETKKFLDDLDDDIQF